MRILHLVLGALCALALGVRADAAVVLYASSSAGTTGELYILNAANGALVQDVGPLNDVSGLNYPITGLAFNPISGVLYGSTGNSVPGLQAKLVTIDPATAHVTLVGSFNVGNTGTSPSTMADLAFTPSGGLYGVGSVGGPQLYSINPATGQATVVGGTGLTSTTGGGLAISPGGAFFGTPTSGRFGTYNSTTGAFTNITNPTKPVGGGYAALAFNDTGVLYGLDLGSTTPPAPPPTHLVTIDTTTGAVTDLGPSLNSLDAIAFRIVPEPGSIAVLIGAAGIGFARRARRR